MFESHLCYGKSYEGFSGWSANLEFLKFMKKPSVGRDLKKRGENLELEPQTIFHVFFKIIFYLALNI